MTLLATRSGPSSAAASRRSSSSRSNSTNAAAATTLLRRGGTTAIVAASASADVAAATTAAATAALDRRAVLLLSAALSAAAAAPSASTNSSNVDYDPYAPSYDGLDGAAPADALGLPDLRRDLLSRARGHVLELAVGTGLNLPLYDTAAGGGAAAAVDCGSGGWFGPPSSSTSPAPGAPALCSVTGVDLSRGMLAEAARRAEALSSASGGLVDNNGAAENTNTTTTTTTTPRRPLALVSADGDATARDASGGARDSSVVPLRLVRADAARLPFADASFDTALDTFSLCVLPDPVAALRELSRVTRVGGKVLLLEHSASDFAPLAAYQRATERVVAATSKGCAWAQDVVGMVERTPGLRVTSVARHLPGGVLVSVEAERVV